MTATRRTAFDAFDGESWIRGRIASLFYCQRAPKASV
jgi:hypothetical protein